MQRFTLSGFAHQGSIIDHHSPMPTKPTQSSTALRIGKIQRTTDEDANRGDFHVVLDSGERIIAQPLSPSGATNHGVYRNVKVMPETPGEDENAPIDRFKQQGQQDSYVLVGFANGHVLNPVILGHYQPQVNQINGAGRGYTDRHYTDNTTIIDDEGNYANYAPDGTGMVVGDVDKDSPKHHDPNPANGGIPNYDVNDMPWELTKKRDSAFTITQVSGDTRTKHWPDGRVSIQQGNGSVYEIHQNGDHSITSPGLVCINSPTMTIAGDLFVNGSIQTPNSINAGSVSAPAGGVPGPLGPAGSTGSAGPTIAHDVAKDTNTFHSK